MEKKSWRINWHSFFLVAASLLTLWLAKSRLIKLLMNSPSPVKTTESEEEALHKSLSTMQDLMRNVLQLETTVAYVHPDQAILSQCVQKHNASTDDCVSLENMVPSLKTTLTQKGFEFAMSEEDKEKHEITLGRSLRMWKGVKLFTDRIFHQTVQLLTAGSKLVGHGGSQAEILKQAFGWNGRSIAEAKRFTGYVQEDDIAYVVRQGNIREKWALLYVMNRNKFFEDLLWNLTKLETLDQLPISRAALHTRAELIRNTREHHRGVGGFLFPVVQSWSRFSFKYPQWEGCREEHPACRSLNKDTSDPSFLPPLSCAEKRLQCLPANVRGTSCPVSWCSGQNKYFLRDVPVGNVTGYLGRIRSSGFRAVAGPSATTANMLQLATLLGFEGMELSLVVLCMLAWMLPAHDHSLVEILLAAVPFFALQPPTALD